MTSPEHRYFIPPIKAFLESKSCCKYIANVTYLHRDLTAGEGEGRRSTRKVAILQAHYTVALPITSIVAPLQARCGPEGG
jgi:hypothetical protein